MNKDLDKRLQLYIAKMAVWELPYGDSEWNSSAKNLEDALRARGINFKLYYQYKMPGGVSQSDFLIRLCMLEFFIKFYSKYAIKVLNDKNLTASDKTKIFQYVWHNRRKFIKESEQYESDIRRLNPELANVKTNLPGALVDGATFGFAPDEIEYFSDVKNRNFEQEGKTIEFFEKNYGIHISYILAPKTAKTIIAALKNKEKVNSYDKNQRE